MKTFLLDVIHMNGIFDDLNTFLTNLVIILIGLSTLIAVLDICGFLPGRVRKWFQLNRADDTIEVLKRLGIETEQYKRHNNALRFPKSIDSNTIKETTRKEIDKYQITKPISVGHLSVTQLDTYYDLIGATCNATTAEYFAKILSSYWSVVSLDNEIVNNPYFDFVVTPKEGSPLLGYEFAKICRKPFVLHESRARFQDNSSDMRSWFNCSQIPEKGLTAILVDDSVTGGYMMEQAAKHLRQYGYHVNVCLVVFEVYGHSGRQCLKNMDINLVEVVKTHKKND